MVCLLSSLEVIFWDFHDFNFLGFNCEEQETYAEKIPTEAGVLAHSCHRICSGMLPNHRGEKK
jgi:hypothetical protein